MPVRSVATHLIKPYRSKLDWLARKKSDRTAETLQYLGENTRGQRQQRRAHRWKECVLMPGWLLPWLSEQRLIKDYTEAELVDSPSRNRKVSCQRSIFLLPTYKRRALSCCHITRPFLFRLPQKPPTFLLSMLLTEVTYSVSASSSPSVRHQPLHKSCTCCPWLTPRSHHPSSQTQSIWQPIGSWYAYSQMETTITEWVLQAQTCVRTSAPALHCSIPENMPARKALGFTQRMKRQVEKVQQNRACQGLHSVNKTL